MQDQIDLEEFAQEDRERVLRILDRKARLQNDVLTDSRALTDYKRNNLIEFFEPFKWQQRALDLVRRYNIVLVPAPNKIGKTVWWVNVLGSWMLGYEPWNEVPEGTPGAIQVKGKFYNQSSLGIKPPVQIRVSSEDWKHTIGQTVVPKLLEWLPSSKYKAKRNEQGVEYLFEFFNGSTFEILTHGAEDRIWESWFGHGWIPDEPPPYKKFSAMSRGIFLTGGKILIPVTPLSEAWLLDELILSGRSDVGYIDGLSVLDNDLAKEEDDNLLRSLGLSDGDIEKYYDLLLPELKSKDQNFIAQDRGRNAERFLRSKIKLPEDNDQINPLIQLKILRWVKDCPPEQRPSRLFGRFMSLVGRVIKGYSNEKHIVEAFKIPSHFPVVPVIDFHLSVPQALSYFSLSDRDIWYNIDEVWEHLSAEEIAEDIIFKKYQNNWRMREVFIDPLSKGDDKYIKNRSGKVKDSFTIISDLLRPHGMKLIVGSKDRKSGVTNVNTALGGVNGLPTVYFFDSLPSNHGEYGILHEIMRWVRDDKGEPKDEYHHFLDNFWRVTLSGVKYRPLKPKKPRNVRKPVNSSTGW